MIESFLEEFQSYIANLETVPDVIFNSDNIYVLIKYHSDARFFENTLKVFRQVLMKSNPVDQDSMIAQIDSIIRKLAFMVNIIKQCSNLVMFD